MRKMKQGCVAILVAGLFFNVLGPIVTAFNNEETIQNNETVTAGEQDTVENSAAEANSSSGTEVSIADNEYSATVLYAAPVPLPAPINQAFPDPQLAEAIAVALYNNANATSNTVSQVQLSNISYLNIRNSQSVDVLEQLTAYGGYFNLKILNVSGAVAMNFPANFDGSQFPDLEQLVFTFLKNTALPDFQLPKLKSLKLENMHQLTELIDYSGMPLLEAISADYANALVQVADFSHLPNLKSIIITSAGNLKSIPDFQYVPNLILLNTNYTLLDEAVNFSHLPNLKTLNHSSKGELPDYNYLPNLTSLSIMGGTFSVIPDFSHIPELSYTYLWTNNASLTVPDFQHLPNMKSMTIRGNNNGLTTSPTNTVPDFAYMPLMNSLTITGYAITHVPDFSYMPILKKLMINSTKLNVVPDFSHIPVLEELSLSENLLPEVPNFQYIPILKYLTISNSLITEFPDFDNLTKLNTLYIQKNKITTFPDWNMPELQKLYAVSNFIDTLPEFTNMKALQQLTLTDNYLQTIDNLDLPNVTTLSLDKNRLKQLPALDLLPKMSSFTVAENALPELPQSVLGFPTSSLTPQGISQSVTVEAGTDFITNLPIVDQLKAKESNLDIYMARIDNQNVDIGPLNANMVIPTSTLALGSHSVYLNMGTSSSNVLISAVYKVTVVDTTPPVITADAAITYEAGSELPDVTDFLSVIHASAVDAIDGSVAVTTDLSSLQMYVPGQYPVQLRATDAAGNVGTLLVTVHIVDTTPPVITADAAITYEAGSELPDATDFLSAIHANAVDSVDGAVAIAVDFSKVNMRVAGAYGVQLSATDAAGNRTIVDVTLRIIEASSGLQETADNSQLAPALPVTGQNMFVYLTLGAMALIISCGLLIYRRRT